MKKFKVYQDKFDYLLCVPAILLLLAIFTYWILLYNEFVPFLLFYAASMVLIPLCIIAVMGLLLRKKIKKSILVFLPVVLTLFIIFTQGNNFITYSRHYIEFWIQKTIYVPEISRTQGSVEYKEWSVRSNTWAEYRIVYDPTDEVVKKMVQSIF